jgi:hypothetical protein
MLPSRLRYLNAGAFCEIELMTGGFRGVGVCVLAKAYISANAPERRADIIYLSFILVI